MELPLSAFLRSLVAKHGPRVPKLLWGGDEVMLHRRTNTSGRAFRTQGQAVVVSIVERIHLFLNNIGDLSDRASKQSGRFDNRQANFAVTVGLEDGCQSGIYMLPPRGIIGQDIDHPTNGSVFSHENPVSYCER